jgi:hypothetical protein
MSDLKATTPASCQNASADEIAANDLVANPNKIDSPWTGTAIIPVPAEMTKNDGLDQSNPSNEGRSLVPLCSVDDQIVRRGQEAMERKRGAFEDWIAIGKAFQVGRTKCMQAAQTNEPTGKRYSREMEKWLEAHGFGDIDKADRSNLLKCVENLPAIKQWRSTLTKNERFKFNHPTTVWRRWKAKTQVPNPKKPSAWAKEKAANIELQEENYRLKREIERGGGDLWTPQDTADDIATVMVVKLTPHKAECVARAILKKLKENGDA